MGKEGVAADGPGGLRVFGRRRQSDAAFHEGEWEVERGALPATDCGASA